MIVDKLFPTLLYHGMVDDFDSIQNELQTCYDQLNFERFDGVHWISVDPFKRDLIREYNMVNFENAILENVKKFSGQKSKIYSSWFAKFKTLDYGHVHNHGCADVSGVYYFKTSGTGQIFFQDPTPGLGNRTTRWSYDAVEGKMILFPGWLYHGIKANTSDGDRVSVSFNLKFQ